MWGWSACLGSGGHDDWEDRGEYYDGELLLWTEGDDVDVFREVAVCLSSEGCRCFGQDRM